MCIRDRTDTDIHLIYLGEYDKADYKLAQNGPAAKQIHMLGPVSYTHLDVYKRQEYGYVSTLGAQFYQSTASLDKAYTLKPMQYRLTIPYLSLIHI